MGLYINTKRKHAKLIKKINIISKYFWFHFMSILFFFLVWRR